MISVSSLLKERMRLMYRLDAYGRLVATAYPGTPAAPRVHIMRTFAGNVWATRADTPGIFANTIDVICRREPILSSCPSRWQTRQEMLQAITSLGPLRRIHHGPAFVFSEDIPEVDDVVRVDESNSHVFVEELRDMRQVIKHVQPCYAVVVDGVAASMCHNARDGLTMAEAGVTTLERFRGRGYAIRVVAAWARAIRAEGRTPLYSTDWGNTASRAVARRLGLICYGEDINLR